MSMMFVAALMMAQTAGVTEPLPAQPAVEAAKPEKEKKICRVDTTESTSRLRKRVCMTQSEWDRAETGKDVTDLKSMGAH